MPSAFALIRIAVLMFCALAPLASASGQVTGRSAIPIQSTSKPQNSTSSGLKPYVRSFMQCRRMAVFGRDPRYAASPGVPMDQISPNAVEVCKRAILAMQNDYPGLTYGQDWRSTMRSIPREIQLEYGDLHFWLGRAYASRWSLQSAYDAANAVVDGYMSAGLPAHGASAYLIAYVHSGEDGMWRKDPVWRQYLKVSARVNYLHANYTLGNEHCIGEKFPKDRAKCEAYLSRALPVLEVMAATRDEPYVFSMMAYIHTELGNNEDALKYARKAKSMGNPVGQEIIDILTKKPAQPGNICVNGKIHMTCHGGNDTLTFCSSHDGSVQRTFSSGHWCHGGYYCQIDC